MKNFVDLWVYLSGSPLLLLTAIALKRHPVVNPVLIAVMLVSLVLLATGTSFPAYFAGAQFVHFLLGPATVALAIPLVRNLPEVKRLLFPMLGALVVGSASAVVSTILLAQAVGLDAVLTRALTPKSATALSQWA
jgi:putative effector of murein hydrolase